MGGRGSGRHWRWDKKPTIETVNRVDIRFMKKHRMLRPGHVGSLAWSCGDKTTGSIRFRSFHDRLMLDYRIRKYGGGWEDVKQTIRLDWTACNYGGERPWLCCPRCNRRVAVLCGDGKYFLCRHCYQLPYSSQMESYHDRMLEQSRKIRRRLGVSEVIVEQIYPWDKPKGMHRKTFERLIFQEKQYRVACFNWMSKRWL